MHQQIVPIVPRTFAEVGIEVWGGILVGVFCERKVSGCCG